jgi:hypothetical protein
MSYEQDDQDAIRIKWIAIFVVLSLCAHAALIFFLIFFSKFIPTPKLEPTAVTPTATQLTLIQPPPPVAPPKPKTIFMPTPDQKNAKHKDELVESDHDTVLASKDKTSRKDNSIMPDVKSPDKKSSSLDSSPSAPPTKPQDTPSTPPTPKTEPAKPTPPTPPTPPQPTKEETKPDPAKTPPQPQKVEQPAPQPPPKPVPQVDENGLPVLPALNAQTLAQQNPTAAQQQQKQQAYAPPPSLPIVPADIQGRAGISGQPTPAAMKTDLGMYKARFYQAVGSRWYAGVAKQMQLIGVGSVTIQYTISPEGIVTYKVLNDGGGDMMILKTISIDSIRGASPFLPFPPSMLRDYPDGYTDTFSFSIY